MPSKAEQVFAAQKLTVALLSIPVCLGASALKLKTLVCNFAYLGSDAVSLG